MDAKLKPHQSRVVDEKIELGVKLEALNKFIESNEQYLKLSDESRFLLTKQREIMHQYVIVLGDRISLFLSGKE
jgi:hypothetical protein